MKKTENYWNPACIAFGLHAKHLKWMKTNTAHIPEHDIAMVKHGSGSRDGEVN